MRCTVDSQLISIMMTFMPAGLAQASSIRSDAFRRNHTVALWESLWQTEMPLKEAETAGIENPDPEIS